MTEVDREKINVGWWETDDGAVGANIKLGFRGVEKVIPPAGAEHSYEKERWARRVEVYVSPTGRSVRVWVDGKEIR